jgi:serine/threonine protein phosphatase 1
MIMSRIIAIGDVHGCSAALQAVLDAITPTPDDTIIGIGDYIDRGPDSRGVIDILLKLQEQCNFVALRGNHEIMMMHSFEDYLQAPMWVQSGGLETLDSYDGAPENVPLEHFNFLRRTKPSHETDGHLFVHANYDPRLSLDKQPDELRYWEHLHGHMPEPHYSGKIVVVGHTPQEDREVLDAGHLICIDTCCYGGGWLTALDVVSGTIWQANSDGELRSKL